MRNLTKILAVIGGIIGILATVLTFIEPSLGWWEVNQQLIVTNSAYLNPYGYNVNGDFAGELFLIGGLLFLASSILVILVAAKGSKGGSILFAFLMIVGLALFCYALYSEDHFESILSGLEWLFGADYNIFFGSVDLGIFGLYTWRLGNGFFVACAGAAISLVGAFLVKRK
ncbi:hypothetical protein ES706_06127 [subsurface metagenome]